MRHIDTKFHYIKELVSNSTITLVKTPSFGQKADFLTELLSPCKLHAAKSAVGLISADGGEGCSSTNCASTETAN